MGPLTRSNRRNVAILAVLDGFSKFVTFSPTRKITFKVVCDRLERQYFPADGTPRSIVTDNVQVFRTKSFKDLCFRCGRAHITSTPYYPQGSLVERVNRNLKAALKIFHHQSQQRRDEDMPWLSAAFNTVIHESNQSTPDKLFLGRELQSPLLAKWDLTPESRVENQSFWADAYACLKRARDRECLI
jgi:hypothetical protein